MARPAVIVQNDARLDLPTFGWLLRFGGAGLGLEASRKGQSQRSQAPDLQQPAAAKKMGRIGAMIHCVIHLLIPR